MADDRELVEELSNLRALVKMPGFKTYLETLEKMRETQIREMDQPLTEVVEVLRQEFIKGHRHGLGLAARLVSDRIYDIETQLEEMGVDYGNYDNAEYRTDD